jgi:hypothetical protein
MVVHRTKPALHRAGFGLTPGFPLFMKLVTITQDERLFDLFGGGRMILDLGNKNFKHDIYQHLYLLLNLSERRNAS